LSAGLPDFLGPNIPNRKKLYQTGKKLYQTGKKLYQTGKNYTKRRKTIPNGYKIYQMAVKDTKWQ
jgi:hypothetical protein